MYVVYSNNKPIEKVFNVLRPSSNQLTLDVVLHFSSTARLYRNNKSIQ